MTFERKTKEDNPVLAICYDFDKTLSPDDMQAQGYIQSVYDGEVDSFWKESNKMAEDNEMDPNLAYMYKMVQEARGRIVLTKKSLQQYGADVTLFPGVEDWFDRIKNYGLEKGVIVEHYIISSGLKEMIEGTSVAKAGAFEKIYASSFLFDEYDVPIWPAQAVNYTNKTQFLFRIEKGVLDVNDYGVNDHFGKNNDAKMAFLQDNNYNVKLIGTDKGEMKYTMSVLDSGKEIQRIVFEKIEITDTTVIYTNTDRFNSIVLNVDIDNDGVIDYQINPSYILTEDEIDNLENNYANETTLFFQNSSIITSSVETGIQIYSGSVNINKSISTDGLCEIYANEVNAIDCNSSALYINGQTAESKKQLSYLEATKGIDELLYDVQDTMPEDAVSTTETDMIYFTTHNISDFITANSISIYLDKIISDENCVLYSRNGDINISGSEINYNGIIYAPNGIVTISANDVCISGTIIAKKVIVYGNDVTFK